MFSTNPLNFPEIRKKIPRNWLVIKTTFIIFTTARMAMLGLNPSLQQSYSSNVMKSQVATLANDADSFSIILGLELDYTLLRPKY